MKFYFCIVIVSAVFGTASLRAQQPYWVWAKSAGGMKQDHASSVAVDSAGEVFVTGYYQDTANFSGLIVRSSKGNHFFLAKYSADGALLWVQTSRLTGHSAGTGLCISQNKYLYLTGYFSDSLEFPVATLFSASGTSNFFLAKYDLDGTFQWAKGEGASGADMRKGVASDPEGNAYVCGSFSANATFDAIDVTIFGNSAMYIAKFDPAGNVLWAKGFGSSSSSNAGVGIATDRSQHIFLTGSIGDTVDFGGTKLIAKGTSDIFIAKFDSGGNAIWARSAGALDMGEGVSVTIDRNQDAYVTGSFSGSAPSLDCQGAGNIFIAKYSSGGVLQWMKCDGDRGEESGNAIAADSSGFIYVSGGCDSPVDFGSGPITSYGLIDAFTLKLNSSGSVQWAQATGGAGTDLGTAIASGPRGVIYLSGDFSNTCTFTSPSLQSFGLTDIFIAKMEAQSGIQHSFPFSHSPISLFPNPAKNQMTVEYFSERADETVRIELFSMLGVSLKKILSNTHGIGKEKYTISTPDLPSGTYICHLSCSGNITSAVIVIGE